MSESGPGRPSSDTTTGDKDSSVQKCRVCGRSGFDSRRGLSSHMSRSHDGQPLVTKAELQKLYVEEDLGTRVVADRLGLSKTPILRALKYYDIDVERTPSKKPPTLSFDRMSEKVGHEYTRIKPNIDGQHYTIGIHRLVAIAHGKMGIEDLWNHDYVVHHKSEHGLDNRPDNLEVLTPSEHISLHKSG